MAKLTKRFFKWTYEVKGEPPWGFECTVPDFKKAEDIDDFSEIIGQQIKDNLRKIHNLKTTVEEIIEKAEKRWQSKY